MGGRTVCKKMDTIPQKYILQMKKAPLNFPTGDWSKID